MTTQQQELDKKIDNIQGQIDMMQHGDQAFRGYVHRQFDVILGTMVVKEDLRLMATKEDLREMESRLRVDMATKEDLNLIEAGLRADMMTKQDLHQMESRLRVDMVTKEDIRTMTTQEDIREINLRFTNLETVLSKIATKVGVKL